MLFSVTIITSIAATLVCVITDVVIRESVLLWVQLILVLFLVLLMSVVPVVIAWHTPYLRVALPCVFILLTLAGLGNINQHNAKRTYDSNTMVLGIRN